MKSNFLKGILTLLVLALLVACGGPASGPPSGGDNDSKDDVPVLKSSTISGRIVDSAGEPVAGVQVTAVSADAETAVAELAQLDSVSGADSAALLQQAIETLGTATSVTDENGKYELTVDGPGTYTISAIGNGIGVITTVTLDQDGDGNVSGQEVQLTAEALGAIEGTATLPGSAAPSGILVYARGTSFLALTNSKGEFVISNVPAGSYKLAAMKGGYVQGPVTDVTVKSGESTKLSSAISLLEPSGPVITSALPEVVGAGDVVTITGSGFGPSRRNSVIEYAGIPLLSGNIKSWSDTKVEVIYDGIDPWQMVPYVALEEATFSLFTSTGEATSTPVQLFVWANYSSPSNYYSEPSTPQSLELEFYTVTGPLEGVTLDLALSQDRGTLESSTLETDEWASPLPR